MKLIKFIGALLIPLILAITVIGCATFEKNINTERLIVQVATMKFIENGGAPNARATRVIDFTNDTRTLISYESFGIDELKTQLVQRILASDLNPSDRILATMLVTRITDELKTRVVDGVSIPVPQEELRYQVNTVLDWVEEAARMY